MAKKNKGKSKNKTSVNAQKPNTETKESERGEAVDPVNTSNSNDEAWEQVSTSKETEKCKNSRQHSPQKNDDLHVDTAQKMPSEDYQKRNERWQDSSQKGDRRVYDNKYVSRRSEPLNKGYGNDRFDNRRGIDKRRSYNDNVTENKRTSYGRSDSFNGRRNEDPEFKHWQDTYRATNRNIEYVKTREIDNDLFQMPKEFSLAHCVAEDLNMGSGIAVAFRREFKRVDELLNQRQKTGGLAVLEDNGRFIYYLITKQFSSGKPTNATLFASLQKLREHIIDHQITKLSMPRIGCGLDRLRWEEVKSMIEFVFRNVEIEIVICNLVQTDDKSTPPRHKNSEVFNVTYPIEDIESGTIIVYLSSEDGHISEEMSKLDNKFHFLTEFRFAAKRIGTVVTYTKNENYLLCGCIVRRKETDPVDFQAFQTCLYDIRKTNAKYKFEYIGFQAMKDNHDDTINWKIINILRNTMRDTYVYICWVGDLQNELLAKERDTKPKLSLDKDLQGPNRQETNKRADDGNWRNPNSGKTLEFNNSSQNNWSWNQAPSTTGTTSTADFKVESDWNMSPEKESSFTEYREEHEEKKIDWFENNGNTPNLQNSNLASSISVKTHSDEQWDSESDDHLQSPQKKYKTNDNITRKESRNLNKTGPDRKVYGTLYSDRIDIKLRKVSISESNEDDDVASINHEFEMFEEELKQGRLKKSSVVKDVDHPSNLPKQYSRACYVTQRMNVESSVPYGINIRDYLGQLLDQNKKEGDVAIVKHERDILYCLIIKQAQNTTPKRKMVFTAIKKMKNHAIENRIQTIVVPKLDDKSSWDDFRLDEIKCMLEFIFRDTRIKIFMAPFGAVSSHPEIKVEHSKSALHQMKKGSVILYWASKDGYVTDEIKSLERNFKLIKEFQNEAKFKGEIITHARDNITLYGCVIRDYYNDPISFAALQECINDINKSNQNQTKSSPLVGIQAVNDSDDDTNFKIISLLETCLQNVTTLKVCWPGHLKEKMPS